MKNFNYIINAALTIAVIVLFLLVSKKGEKPETQVKYQETESKEAVVRQDGSAQIAYVDMERLNKEYKLYKKMEKSLQGKSTSSESELQKKVKNYQERAYEAGMRYQNKLMTTAEYNEALKTFQAEEQQLMMLEQQLTEELMKDQQKMNDQLMDSIKTAVQDFNKDKKYVAVFHKQVMLDAFASTDITDTIVAILNKHFVE